MNANSNPNVYLRTVSLDPNALDLTRRMANWWNSAPDLGAGYNWVALTEEEQGPFSLNIGMTVKVITQGPSELIAAYQSSRPGQVFIIIDGLCNNNTFNGFKLPEKNVFLHAIELEHHKSTLQAIITALDRNRRAVISPPKLPSSSPTVYTGCDLRILLVDDCARGPALSSGLWFDSDYDPERLIGRKGRRGHHLTIASSLSHVMEILSTTNEQGFDLILAPMNMIYDGCKFIGGVGGLPIDLHSAVSSLGMVLPFGNIIMTEGVCRGIPVGLIGYEDPRGVNNAWVYPTLNFRAEIGGYKAFVHHHGQRKDLQVGTRWDWFLYDVLSNGPTELHEKAYPATSA